MIDPVTSTISPDRATSIAPRRAWALTMLAEAWDAAQETGAELWDFAVEISSLLNLGLTINDLRWLCAIGYVEHAVEATQAQDATRIFVLSHNLSFSPRTCFVATEAGLAAAGQPRDQSASVEKATATSVPIRCFSPLIDEEAPSDVLVPTWDRDRRVLRLGDTIVKQFRVPSPSQETILKVFEEEGWPAAIDDPLPPQPEQDSKRRLRATLQSLNGGQKNRLIRFRGDGSGERIVWELTAAAGGLPALLHGARRRAA